MNTPHSYNCIRVFKNYDLNCPRCLELKSGSLPRAGWQQAYFKNKIRDEAIRLHQIKTHDCKKNHCGYICTAFEW